MYLRTLHVRHIKRLSDFTLDLTRSGKPRMWTVLIGENGTAKTTLLQAVGLLAAGFKSADGLSRSIIGHLRDRRSNAPLLLEADFDFTERGRALESHPLLAPGQPFATLSGLRGRLGLRSWLRLPEGSTGFEGGSSYTADGAPIATLGGVAPGLHDPLVRARDHNLRSWFVAAYGIARWLPDPSASPPLDRPSYERLEPLFNHRASLISTSFTNYFAGGSKDKARRYLLVLKQALLTVDSLLPDIKDVELRGSGGVTKAGDLLERDKFEQAMGAGRQKIPGVALSHGYQSSIAWIADLVGHIVLEANDPVAPSEMEGLVLIDEIDLYLHPTWQVTLIPALRKTFPKLQFIVSTHSPLVLAGLAADEIVRLRVDETTGDVIRVAYDKEGTLVDADRTADTIAPDPRALTGSELFRTFFGIETLIPAPYGAELRRYELLSGDPYRSAAEDKEMKELEKTLTREGIDHRVPVRRKRAP